MNTQKNNFAKKIILINGYFHCRRLTGIERYAIEITSRLDKICNPCEIAIIVPEDARIPNYKNLSVIRHGKTRRHIFWQMITLQCFLAAHRKYTVLDFGNTCLPFTPGIVFLHDIYCEFFPEDFKSIRDKLVRLYNRAQYRLIAKKAKRIATVSEFSKNQIAETYHTDPKRITVIYSSWNHFRDIHSDYSVFEEFPTLAKGSFYFSLGSLSKRKNIRWLIDYAVKHPKESFAISGDSLPTTADSSASTEKHDNILLLGYLSDAKVKALMQKCKAFILPSYYEGFGLTPLEALSCGAKIVVANAASLSEIYGDSAHYIDPFDTDIDIDELLKQPVSDPQKTLDKYSYEKSADAVYKLIQEYVGN